MTVVGMTNSINLTCLWKFLSEYRTCLRFCMSKCSFVLSPCIFYLFMYLFGFFFVLFLLETKNECTGAKMVKAD